jgi:hypothetical protein
LKIWNAASLSISIFQRFRCEDNFSDTLIMTYILPDLEQIQNKVL